MHGDSTITADGVVPCGSAKKSPKYIIHSADYIFLLVLCNQRLQRRHSGKSDNYYRFRYIFSQIFMFSPIVKY